MEEITMDHESIQGKEDKIKKTFPLPTTITIYLKEENILV
jgi:hypothetical protein